MATVTRVLPWRRNSVPPAEEVAPLVSAFRSHHPKSSPLMITRAYELAADAHRQQVRKSGESYIHHPLAVGAIVADLGLDDITIAAALLHDAVEDTHITLQHVIAEFGPDVAGIVDGVTKLERIQFDSKEAQQAATMRKMLVAMAKDVRVLIIKLADRLAELRIEADVSGRPKHLWSIYEKMVVKGKAF
ncbi:MAG: diphosphokinase / guanosine-3,5-bis(diphosphate) 3-diphosphatase, partial [Acidimicrobiaceae bacterium]